MISQLLSVGLLFILALLLPLNFSIASSVDELQQNASTVHEDALQWIPDMQVVIDDDNQIKLEPMSAARKSKLAESAEQNSLDSNFDGDYKEDGDLQLFESKRLSPLNSSSSSTPTYEAEKDLTTTHSQSGSVSTLNRYTKRPIAPSSSKIPDYVAEQLMASNQQSHFHVDDDEAQSTPRPSLQSSVQNQGKFLEVPIGSRVHTVKFQDYSKPDSSRVVGKFYDRYENNVIYELPSSKAVLPIVFNFRTQSSPIVTTQSHFKVANSAPKVQFFRTVEPAHQLTHVVHKPIYQDLKEYVVPYRVYMQSIAPTEEYRETQYVPVEKGRKPSINYPVYTADYTANYGDSPAKRVHQPTAFTYDSQPVASSPAPGFGYSRMMHTNPYMDISYHIPYRIEDLYKKPLLFEEPKYLSVNKFNKYNH